MAETKYDIISIGDTTLDMFLEIDEATVLCDRNKENCKICISYADKVPLTKVTKVSGVGNAANNAVGSSRLGLKSALYTILGDDGTGREIAKKLKSEGIADDYILFDKNRGTNYSAVISFKGERTILVFHQPRDYDLPPLTSTRWLYFSSLAAGHERLHKQIPDFVKRNRVKLGFNPGTFQLKEGVSKLKPVLKVTNILILNKEEAQALVGKEKDIKKLLASLKKEGPEIVVITDGPKGSYALDGNDFYFQEIFDVPIVERTGCGDSYSTGLIAALIYGHNITEAMRWGTVNAAFVLQHIGAQKGLLRKEKLEKILKENPKFQPRKI
ncbi:MAG: carbohydrate kinase family protein [Patescibacteria group bacterium]